MEYPEAIFRGERGCELRRRRKRHEFSCVRPYAIGESGLSVEDLQGMVDPPDQQTPAIRGKPAQVAHSRRGHEIASQITLPDPQGSVPGESGEEPAVGREIHCADDLSMLWQPLGVISAAKLPEI